MVIFGSLLIVAIPLMTGIIFGASLSTGFAIIFSTLALQAAAGAVGLGLGLHPVLILFLTTSIATGCMYCIYELCELFASSSPRITRWLKKIEDKTRNSPYVNRFGPLILIPVIWIPGISLYGSPLVGWLFRWNRWSSLLCMMIGWMIAIIVVMATSLGLLQLFFK